MICKVVKFSPERFFWVKSFMNFQTFGHLPWLKCNEMHRLDRAWNSFDNYLFLIAWGYSILAVTIISLASMLGAFVVPCMNKEFYKKVLLFMVSLAVGVLGGSGIFHLMPHVSYAYKALFKRFAMTSHIVPETYEILFVNLTQCLVVWPCQKILLA